MESLVEQLHREIQAQEPQAVDNASTLRDPESQQASLVLCNDGRRLRRIDNEG